MSEHFDLAHSLNLARQIVNDINSRTGYSFHSFNKIDLADPAVARRVLPILSNWVEMLELPNLRGGIYGLFGTTSVAYEWFDRYLAWWLWETDKIERVRLTGLIARNMRDKDGPAVWNMCKDHRFPLDSLMFARLIRIEGLRREVGDRILADLTTGSLRISDVLTYSRVTDVRVQKWFLHESISSSDPNIRKVGRRLQSQLSAAPEWIAPAKDEPDRRDSLYSTEIDLSQLDRELGRIAKKFGFPPRRLGKNKMFLSFADPHQWFKGEFSASAELWLRAEDQDVVELVVMPPSETGSGSCAPRRQ